MQRWSRRACWIAWRKEKPHEPSSRCAMATGHAPSGNTIMKRLAAAAFLALAFAGPTASALTLQLGVVAVGGSCFMLGSYLDAKAANLALQGANGSTFGTSRVLFFPGISAGFYAETPLLSWLSLRGEVRGAYLGASRLALTASGAPLDAFGVGFYALEIPVLARASLPLGPGSVTFSLGPFYGVVLGQVHVQDIYPVTSTSASVPLTFLEASMGGLSGGAGYTFRLGPGTMSAELRADWTVLPARLDAGTGSGDLAPLNAAVFLSYGLMLAPGGGN
jgi:hypothetical protein